MLSHSPFPRSFWIALVCPYERAGERRAYLGRLSSPPSLLSPHFMSLGVPLGEERKEGRTGPLSYNRERGSGGSAVALPRLLGFNSAAAAAKSYCRSFFPMSLSFFGRMSKQGPSIHFPPYLWRRKPTRPNVAPGFTTTNARREWKRDV